MRNSLATNDDTRLHNVGNLRETKKNIMVLAQDVQRNTFFKVIILIWVFRAHQLKQIFYNFRITKQSRTDATPRIRFKIFLYVKIFIIFNQ